MQKVTLFFFLFVLKCKLQSNLVQMWVAVSWGVVWKSQKKDTSPGYLKTLNGDSIVGPSLLCL